MIFDRSLNNNLADISLRYDSVSGKPQWKERGADTWNPFSTGYSNVVKNYTHVSTDIPGVASTTVKVPTGVTSCLVVGTTYSYNNDANVGVSLSISGTKSYTSLLPTYHPSYQSGVVAIWKCEVTPGSTLTVTGRNEYYGAITTIAALLY